MSTDPNRPFDGQSHTDDGERGKTEIKGVRFRDLCDCVVKALVYAASFTSENEKELRQKVKDNTICCQDLYELELSKMSLAALIQNISCEVEKFMGIFPNVRERSETMPSTPPELLEHFAEWQDGTWRDYTISELGDWVHLLHKRATHRITASKRLKDLEDARNYWIMIGSWLDSAEKNS